jgi:hypothetical protein
MATVEHREYVDFLCSILPKEGVARVLEITVAELERDYPNEILSRGARSVGLIQHTVYTAAINGDDEMIDLIEEMHVINPRAWPLLGESRRQ